MIRGIIFPTQDGMGARRYAAGDFGQMGIHGFGADGGQHEARCRTTRRADRAKRIRPLLAGIAGGTGPGATSGPKPGERAPLTNTRVHRENRPPDGFPARLTLEPDFEGPALRGLGGRRRYGLAEVFLNVSCAP
jgi:hypothetical protein